MKNPEKDFEAIKQREYKVVKHNALIESVVPYMDKVTKQKHILKAVEQRAVNFILSLISPNCELQRNLRFTSEGALEVEFPISQYCNTCGLSICGKNYKDIKATLQNIATRGFWLDDKKGNSFLFTWITTPKINSDDGTIIVTIPEPVVPLLIKLTDNFTVFSLKETLGLRGNYSSPLYELFAAKAFQKSRTMTIEEIRERFALEDKYLKIEDLRKWVIDPSIKEINELTSLSIKYKAIRSNRKIIGYTFMIEKKFGVDKELAELETTKKIKGVSESRYNLMKDYYQMELADYVKG